MTIISRMPLDCLVVGGGPGGLTSAIYLARFRRTVLVVDSGRSRLSLIPTSHNYPGFPSGINGRELLSRLNLQARQFGASIKSGIVDEIVQENNELFRVRFGNSVVFARAVILATGASDVSPPIEDYERALRKGILRYCPICDGFEAIGKKVAVLGEGVHGAKEAAFIHHYAEDVTLMDTSEDPYQDAEFKFLKASGIKFFDGDTKSLRFAKNAVSAVGRDGAEIIYDIIYSALGLSTNNKLARQLELRTDEDGQIEIDQHAQTSLKAVFAVGDVASGLNQITVATGQAAVAATAIHNMLRQ
ncbi:NAD(P)/FAD-dependent oxidoreductase [Acidovorax sp. LjRoot194]|uniref:NAD(P)/FAD-dependent oxidoreductase n=1 Tax=Acidovorax sp. LjRoot194 TaxID=3342280 RepID=UPI003F5092EC